MVCLAGIESRSPTAQAFVQAVSGLTTSTSTWRQVKRSEVLGSSAPGYPDNPNGSDDAIAGVCNPAGNVLGLMPHPERCSEPELGGTDGRALFESIVRAAVRA